ncbi:RNA pseudouridylate synthase domain-containing protein 1 [Coelomomyces lativittatus]|nr:RNA pseudouridylate synthase domain-containing protein 1 [Coelomomyces lativittatus]
MYSMVTENRKQTPSFSCTETIVFNPAYADSKFKTKIASEEVDFVLATPYQLIKAIEPIHTFSFSFNKQSLTAEVDSFHKKLSVYYHDPDFMIIFKPEDFLIDGDAWSVQEFLQRAYPQYPLFHLVHQLDFATSGIMTLALNKQAAGHACELFRRRVVRKEYIALVHGWVSKD